MSTAVMHKVDALRLRAAVEAIEFDPRRWDQNSYLGECGSTYCLAGWVCHLAGLDVRRLLREGFHDVFQRAMALLDLDPGQADDLFMYMENDRGEHPTVEEFKARITQVTGVTFDV